MRQSTLVIWLLVFSCALSGCNREPEPLTLYVVGVAPSTTYAAVSYRTLDLSSNAKEDLSNNETNQVVALPFKMSLKDETEKCHTVVALGMQGLMPTSGTTEPTQIEFRRGEEVVASCDMKTQQTTGGAVIFKPVVSGVSDIPASCIYSPHKPIPDALLKNSPSSATE